MKGLLIVPLLVVSTLCANVHASDTTMWYEQPAKRWVEALPLGNGRLGAMVFGGVTEERLQLNEESLWAGEPFDTYPDIGPLLPAMGYGDAQVRDLEATLARAAQGGVEAVVVGTPIDLARIVKIPLPHTRARYSLEVRGTPTLEDALRPILPA